MFFDSRTVHIQLLEVVLFRTQNENFLPHVLLLKFSAIKHEVKNFYFELYKTISRTIVLIVYGPFGNQKEFLVQNKFIFIIFWVILSPREVARPSWPTMVHGHLYLKNAHFIQTLLFETFIKKDVGDLFVCLADDQKFIPVAKKKLKKKKKKKKTIANKLGSTSEEKIIKLKTTKKRKKDKKGGGTDEKKNKKKEKKKKLNTIAMVEENEETPFIQREFAKQFLIEKNDVRKGLHGPAKLVGGQVVLLSPREQRTKEKKRFLIENNAPLTSEIHAFLFVTCFPFLFIYYFLEV